MQYLTYAVTAAAIAGTVANSLQKRWCFAVWMCTNVFWCIYDICIHSYAQAILYAFNFVMSIIGFATWRKKDMQRSELLGQTGGDK